MESKSNTENVNEKTLEKLEKEIIKILKQYKECLKNEKVFKDLREKIEDFFAELKILYPECLTKEDICQKILNLHLSIKSKIEDEKNNNQKYEENLNQLKEKIESKLKELKDFLVKGLISLRIENIQKEEKQSGSIPFKEDIVSFLKENTKVIGTILTVVSIGFSDAVISAYFNDNHMSFFDLNYCNLSCIFPFIISVAIIYLILILISLFFSSLISYPIYNFFADFIANKEIFKDILNKVRGLSKGLLSIISIIVFLCSLYILLKYPYLFLLLFYIFLIIPIFSYILGSIFSKSLKDIIILSSLLTILLTLATATPIGNFKVLRKDLFSILGIREENIVMYFYFPNMKENCVLNNKTNDENKKQSECFQNPLEEILTRNFPHRCHIHREKIFHRKNVIRCKNIDILSNIGNYYIIQPKGVNNWNLRIDKKYVLTIIRDP